jgi:hypothetical protein
MNERGLWPGRLAKLAADHPLTFFFTLAYAFAWSFFLPMVLSGALTPRLIVAGTFGPTVAAIVTHRLATGSYRAFRCLSTWPRVIFGAGLGCVLVVVAYVALPGFIAADPRRLHWVSSSRSCTTPRLSWAGHLAKNPGGGDMRSRASKNDLVRSGPLFSWLFSGPAGTFRYSWCRVGRVRRCGRTC